MLVVFAIVPFLVYTILSSSSNIFANSLVQTANALIKDDPVNPHKKDFKILNFGITTNGNPFLNVKGQAGRTVPADNDGGVEFAYEFFTNKGIFVAASDEGPYMSARNIDKTINGIRCLESAHQVGNVIVNGHTLTIGNIKVKSINKVDSVIFEDDENGEHCIVKTLSSKR